MKLVGCTFVDLLVLKLWVGLLGSIQFCSSLRRCRRPVNDVDDVNICGFLWIPSVCFFCGFFVFFLRILCLLIDITRFDQVRHISKDFCLDSLIVLSPMIAIHQRLLNWECERVNVLILCQSSVLARTLQDSLRSSGTCGTFELGNFQSFKFETDESTTIEEISKLLSIFFFVLQRFAVFRFCCVSWVPELLCHSARWCLAVNSFVIIVIIIIIIVFFFSFCSGSFHFFCFLSAVGTAWRNSQSRMGRIVQDLLIQPGGIGRNRDGAVDHSINQNKPTETSRSFRCWS